MSDNDVYDEDNVDKFYWNTYVLSVTMGHDDGGIWLNISPGLNSSRDSSNSGTFFISEDDIHQFVSSVVLKSEINMSDIVSDTDTDTIIARLSSVEKILTQKLDMESPYIAGIVELVKSTSSRIEQLEVTVNELSRSRERNDVLVEHIRGMIESSRNTHNYDYTENQEDDTASDHGHPGQRTPES